MLYERAPGIQGQIDASLDAIREAIRARDMGEVYDQYVYLITLASPHVDNPEKLYVEYPSSDADSGNVFFLRVMKGMQGLLTMLADANIYSYRKRKVQDASDLAEPVTAADLA